MRFSQFCCASSRASKQAEAEAETRRARIVPILDASANTQHPHRRHSSYSNIELPPPRYEDLTSSVSLHAVPVVIVDEKHEHHTLQVVEVDSRHNAGDDEDTRHAMLLPETHATDDEANASGAVQGEGEGSDRSSVLSIPSTQVTGLGSSYTGTTTLRGDDGTGRTSGDDGSRSGGFSETGTLNEGGGGVVAAAELL